MLRLKDHPFAVETFFRTSLVLTYALPVKALKDLVPQPLNLDTLNDEWAFIAVAMVQTKDLRPKGWPAILGNDFFLIGYRLFVRYVNEKGKRLRGLYILKSETDRSFMNFFGNIFTHYHYSKTDIDFRENENNLTVLSKKSGINVKIHSKGQEIPLPPHSPFKNWQEARRYAGPLPFTFTIDKKTKEILIIEGVRQNWIPEPVEVIKHEIGFMQNEIFKEAVLANAFIIREVPYYWKKGIVESWKA